MPATYEPIATTTLGAAASSITFSSIPATYTDLRIVFTATVTVADSALIRFNSDTATNYSRTLLTGTRSAATSSRNSSVAQIYLTNDDISTTSPQLFEIDIFSYAGSTYKTCLIRSSQDKNGSGVVLNEVGLWRSTSAITSFTFVTGLGSFAVGTTATIYGIKAA